jgi:hypothetical protein
VPDRSAYPGDAAAAADVAGWMAYGAAARGVPRELPVMAALEESGLKNLSFGDADEVGYFQMRVGIWNSGAYAGFPTNPPLQLLWFLDQALATKQKRLAAGDSTFGTVDSQYGEWIADVELPAAEFRYRYQLRLAEARGLVGPPCVDEVPPPAGGPPVSPPGDAPPPGNVPPPDITPPTVSLARALGALPLGARVSVAVGCPAESCVVWATGSISVPTTARTYRIAAPRKALASGARGVLRLPLGRKLRKAATTALSDGRRVRGQIVVHGVDQSGNEVTARRAIRLRRR